MLGNNVKITNSEITNSVALGNGSTVTESNVVSVGNENRGGQRRIVNVADGINATDAATVRQVAAVDQRVTNMQNQVVSNTQETREVGAMSAALAGLHYVEPTGEGDDKFTGAVSYGGYRGESVPAVGVAYKPSPNLMLSASTSVGNNQNMYNAGVAFKFGPGKSVNKTVSKEIKNLHEEIRKQNEVIAKQTNRISERDAKIERQSAKIEAQNAKIEQQNMKIELQGAQLQIAQQKAQIEALTKKLNNQSTKGKAKKK